MDFNSDVMSEIKHEHRILEAIDQLRRRKARPDADRICSYLQRRFAVCPADAIIDLQRLVDADIVVKVEYKGNTSYRNAAKWSRYAMYSKSREENQGVNQSLSSLVSSGIAELIVQEPDYLDFGVPRQELKKFLHEKDRTLFSEQHFDIIVQREVGSGNLVILENGNYSLADHPIPTSPSASNSNGNELKMLRIDSPCSSDHHSEDEYVSKEDEADSNLNSTYFVNSKKKEDAKTHDSSPDGASSPKDVPASGFRVGVRRKRAKKVFDPSDNNIPTRKRGRPVGSSSSKLANQNKGAVGGVCYLCRHQARNRRGQNEKLLWCRGCTHKGTLQQTNVPVIQYLQF
ncbi:uncharacterized protein LOC134528426 [Bacillus rossius redtenbacheri]|uniref:uncharacterized protein LOC134528426 n=1 Tax=Bacillus rossius redtenbacheri TaxID=93214 RepID=UPI002FDE6A46